MKIFGRVFFLTLLIVLPGRCLAGDVELAQTPPMGWNSWNCFRTNINDSIIRAQADAMAKNGMREAGYQYIVIDGGWEGYHDANGVFHPDPDKFPDMKGLCDYIHNLGLKVGIHTSPGPTTCAGREASYGHEKMDARTFANWGIDFVKYDWCSADKVYQPEQMQDAYRKMSDDLKATDRPIVFSLCQYGMQDVWKWGRSVGGQMWRTTGDIADNYNSMILHGLNEEGLEQYAGPGHWNDPDMLEVGNGKMTQDEWRTQMSLWGILAAPLFAGNDLTRMNPKVLKILTNPEVIAIDQDAAGIQGHCARQVGPTQIWAKALTDGGMAVGLFNMNNHAMTITAVFKELGLSDRVMARDLWLHKDLGQFDKSFSSVVPAHGSVLIKINKGG
ncbi:MAG TPA: glycoside hydrolase family 27 protein [Alphaproteobacteria bacterium]|nr:glycoside hydrolase family 27 protein [Alphaproteobacteria bacterium]